MAVHRYIQKIDDPLKVLTSGYIAADHPVPEGFEMVEGDLPEGWEQYREKSLQDRLNELYLSLPLEAQADLGPLRAAVKLELEADPPRLDVVRLIIERAQIPPELESARTQFLEAL